MCGVRRGLAIAYRVSWRTWPGPINLQLCATEGEPGRLVLLEINTQPGLTPTSLLPEQAAHHGVSFPQLCAWMVENATCRA